MVIDTGYLAAMSESCSMEIKTVPGMKNMLFGGEGMFNTVVSGPRNHPASDNACQQCCLVHFVHFFHPPVTKICKRGLTN